jgi:multidrug resistance efflux pump
MALNRVKSLVVLLCIGALTCGAAAKPLPLLNRCEVPSPLAGVLVLVGTEIRSGEDVPAKDLVTVRIGEEEKRFRRLRVGDRVEQGQLLARLDERPARAEVAGCRLAIKMWEIERLDAEQERDVAKKRLDAFHQALRQARGCVTWDDIRSIEGSLEIATLEEKAKNSTVRQARLELKSAQLTLSKHEIRSPVSGVIREIYKRPGEGVKAFEPILVIECDDD